MHLGVAFLLVSVDADLMHSRAGVPGPQGAVCSMLVRENSPSRETCCFCLLSTPAVEKGQLCTVSLCEPRLGRHHAIFHTRIKEASSEPYLPCSLPLGNSLST